MEFAASDSRGGHEEYKDRWAVQEATKHDQVLLSEKLPGAKNYSQDTDPTPGRQPIPGQPSGLADLEPQVLSVIQNSRVGATHQKAPHNEATEYRCPWCQYWLPKGSLACWGPGGCGAV